MTGERRLPAPTTSRVPTGHFAAAIARNGHIVALFPNSKMAHSARLATRLIPHLGRLSLCLFSIPGCLTARPQPCSRAGRKRRRSAVFACAEHFLFGEFDVERDRLLPALAERKARDKPDLAQPALEQIRIT